MPALNPEQQKVLDRLGSLPKDPPAFDPNLRRELRQELEQQLAGVAAELDPDSPLRVNKHLLSGVHGCEARWLADDQAPFEVSVPVVRGTVVHKAVELSINWDPGVELVPLELVDAAIASLRQSDSWVNDFLDGASAAERAELRGDANEIVAKFLETWPPLKRAWTPVAETRLTAGLCGHRVRLRGVVDLTLGKAEGNRAGKVVVDLKTGGYSPAHAEDLRFYALVNTLQVGIPPRLLATYYLDEGRFHTESVSEDLLYGAVARTVDGTTRAVALRNGELEPALRPGPACRWCRLLDDCDRGQAHLADIGSW